jgi:PAS domain S-box-containing protein
MNQEWEKFRQKIIGLGEQSSRKSFYPELQEKIDDLESVQRNLESILNNISDAILISDHEGNILSCNSQAKKIFNCTGEEKDHTKLQQLLSDEMNPFDFSTVWEDTQMGKTIVFEGKFRALHSRRKIILQVSVNKTIWNGNLAMVSVMRDFTDQKKHEEDLITARKKAEESDRLKSAFLANLSHEIRTPMNAIMGFTDFLRRPDLASDKRETYISIVRESGNHLLSILDDIIEISRIETGQISPNYSAVNLKNCVSDLYKTLKITIPKTKHIDFILEDSSIPDDVILSTDKVKLSQILANLINNAVKYTEEGRVCLSYTISNSSGNIEFSIEDTGEGIDPKFHTVIFDRFCRLDSDLAMKMGGSGLGLAISKAYVEMLGGAIGLKSEHGKGSVFSFTIPLITAEEIRTSSIPEIPTNQSKGRNELILIAEDDDTNYLFFSKLLTSRNYRVIRAKNGKEAVNHVAENQEIRLVLMDIKMPLMGGIEALKTIRELNPHLPVIAQTAHALPNEEKEIQSEGFDGFLTKPINQTRLFSIINKLLP